MLNALELQEKSPEDVRVVFSGCGAAAMAFANLCVSLGVVRENICMCDSRGVVYRGREAGMNPYKAAFAQETSDRTLADAMRGADVFYRSVGGRVGHAGDGSRHERAAHHLRRGQPRPGDHARRGGPGSQRRYHGHGSK